MRSTNLRLACTLGALCAVGGCARDIGAPGVSSDPVAGLRYVNAVPDTGALDFRVVDASAEAPSAVNATFRTGGAPYGLATLPGHPYFAVLAGTRRIRVFRTGTAAPALFDTTFTFVQGLNYTMYLYGYARGTPAPLHALITLDSVPAIPTGQFALRVIDLAYTIAGNPLGLADGVLDARAALDSAAATGTAQFAGLTPGGVTAYQFFDTTTSDPANPWSYGVALYGTGTSASAPIAFQAMAPAGTPATSTADAVAGTRVSGSALSAFIVPASVAGTFAPQGGDTALVATGIDSLTFAADSVTLWRGINPPDTAAGLPCPYPVAAGAGVNDIVIVSGVAQPEYNGSHAVVSVAPGTSGSGTGCTTPAVPSHFSYRIAGAPASPATGAPTFRVQNTATDFTGPWVVFLPDQKPLRATP